MLKSLTLAIVMGLPITTAFAQSDTPEPESPKQVVERYCAMGTNGAWFTPEGWEGLEKFVSPVTPWSPPKSVRILESYRVGDGRKDIGYKGVVDYQVEVDYFEWGEVDAFLNFRYARNSSGVNSNAGKPVEERTYETLYLSDTFVRSDSSGHEEQEKGPLRWRMASPGPPSVGIDAALRWITEMRDKSSDPAIKHNADRTIAILKNLSTGQPVSTQPTGTPRESALRVGERFLKLEADSVPGQWTALADFFVETPKPQWNNAHVVDIVGTGVDTNAGSADFTVSTNSLGNLDASMRLSNYPSERLPLDTPSASACFGDNEFGFALLLSDKHWETASDGKQKEFEGPLAWRVEETSFEPLITLDTAIRYVSSARDNARDPVTEKNADRTLAILRSFKEGKPLSKELLAASGDTGRCADAQ